MMNALKLNRNHNLPTNRTVTPVIPTLIEIKSSTKTSNTATTNHGNKTNLVIDKKMNKTRLRGAKTEKLKRE